MSRMDQVPHPLADPLIDNIPQGNAHPLNAHIPEREQGIVVSD